MRMRFLWLALVAGLPASECFAIPRITQNGTAEALPTAPSLPAANSTPQAQARPTPPGVVPYEKLIPFLPAAPAGWIAEKPSGSTDQIEVFNLTTVSQTYQKGEEDNAPVVTVTLIDAGGHQGYFESATVLWKTNAETPDGYDKAVEIDGMPGYEHYSKAANSSSLAVVAAKRYFIQIEVTNQDPKQLREWLKKIDVKKLGELK
ncbi:MAG: hypothetical protein NTZ46_11060 [Verrucomicrobia bacterium]|nr:hypothetical protein [Verrucomicrobiota bacterium]